MEEGGQIRVLHEAKGFRPVSISGEITGPELEVPTILSMAEIWGGDHGR